MAKTKKVKDKEPEVAAEEKPVENVYATTINGWIGYIEDTVGDTAFKADNPQSHRILSATLNMFKSARDHLGE